MTTYNKTNWTTSIPINPTNLQKIEDGIENAHNELETHKNDSTVHKSSLTVRTENATALIVETRSTDPTSPEVGRIWLRTDL